MARRVQSWWGVGAEWVPVRSALRFVQGLPPLHQSPMAHFCIVPMPGTHRRAYINTGKAGGGAPTAFRRKWRREAGL